MQFCEIVFHWESGGADRGISSANSRGRAHPSMARVEIRLVHVRPVSQWLRFTKQTDAYVRLYKSDKNVFAYFCFCLYTVLMLSPQSPCQSRWVYKSNGPNCASSWAGINVFLSCIWFSLALALTSFMTYCNCGLEAYWLTFWLPI